MSMNTSRRSLIATAAVAALAPAIPVVAGAASLRVEADPVFAAIADWKEAAANEEAWSNTCDEAAIEQASSARIDITFAIFETVPTTLPGMRAKIDFAMSEHCVTELLVGDDDHETLGSFLETLYEAAARLVVQS
jgi:hypothetical protein